MNNIISPLIDEEPIIFYYPTISNFGVQSKNKKSKIYIGNLLFYLLLKKYFFSNRIMLSFITTKALLDTKKK